jgi:hypothetical protein
MKCSFSYTDEVQQHLRGNYTKKVQLHQQRAFIPIRYIYITVMRYINTYKVHIHLQGTLSLRGHLYLQGIATTTRYSTHMRLSYIYAGTLHLWRTYIYTFLELFTTMMSKGTKTQHQHKQE